MKCTNKNEQPVGYTAREWARIQQKEAQEAKRQRKLILGAAFALFADGADGLSGLLLCVPFP